MKENNLLASVALFSELYNNDKYNSVADIIAEFIKAAVVSENRWSINSTELRELLKKTYDFDFLESVIRTTINTRLKSVHKKSEGLYHFDSSIANDFEKLNSEYQIIRDTQSAIFNNLILYIEDVEQKKLNNDELEDLGKNFHKYLMGNGVTEKYSALISAYVIKNQLNNDFTANLNLIREGVIMYEGIKYTADFGDFNELGAWTTKMTIYLSTEHLFNALGFNGALFGEIFDDFYQLVREINHGLQEKKILLKYFPETWDEVDAFFKTAESIKKGQTSLDPSKPAMKAILDGCSLPSDIVNKKVRFEMDLRSKGILLETETYDVIKQSQYNVEDETVLASLKADSDKQGRWFDEYLCRNLFKIFSKINYFRRGHNKTSFERVGHVFLTANRFALYLAHNTKVKFDNNDQSFAKDLDYVTNTFWFKLKKGFGAKENTPKSFDIITKAQIILSSQLNNTVLNEYQKLLKQHADGILTKDEALQRTFELREKPNRPEDITIENIDQSLDFLNNEQHFEDLAREKQKQTYLFDEIQKEKENLRNEIARRDAIDYKKRLEEEEKSYNLRAEDFAYEQFHEKVKSLTYDSGYALFVYFVTIVPILLGLLLKTFKPLSNKFEQLPDGAQLIILIVLILITATEVFGRSYIFNKPRVLNGWGFIRRLSNKKKRQLFKLEELKASELQYKTDNKFVFPELVDRRITSDIV